MRVLVIPDLHVPFQHPRWLEHLSRVRDRHKTDFIVCLGDLGDQHAWSRFGAHPDAPGAGDEAEMSAETLELLYEFAPVAVAVSGNHDYRMQEAEFRVRIPRRFHRSLAEIYKSPAGWDWRDDVDIDGVLYFHGTGYSGMDCARDAAKVNGQSCVIGHVHGTAGVFTWKARRRRFFAMSAGCLIDPLAPSFHYSRDSRTQPCLGCGVVIDGVPYYEPLPDSDLDTYLPAEREKVRQEKLVAGLRDASVAAGEIDPDDWKKEARKFLKGLNQKIA